MAADDRRPYVDPQRLTGIETDLYELVATFEYQGRPMTPDAIAAATGLEGDAAAGVLQRLTEQNVLVRTDEGGQPAYELARHDWSAQPGLRRHFPPGHGAVGQEPAGQMPPAAGAPEPSRPETPAPGRGQEARAGQVRARHLHEEHARGEEARDELQACGEHADPDDPRRQPRPREPGRPSGSAAGSTAPEHLMSGPSPQGRVRNAPGTLIAAAESGDERRSRARRGGSAVLRPASGFHHVPRCFLTGFVYPVPGRVATHLG
jgi:hypothetical protein